MKHKPVRAISRLFRSEPAASIRTRVLGVFRPLGMALLLGLFIAGCDNKTPEEHMAEAELQFAAGELNAAILEAKNALQKSDQFAEARVMLGRIYAANNDHNSAVGEFERALDLGASGGDLQTGLLRSKLRLGRVQEVLGSLQDKSELDADEELILADALLLSGNPVEAKPLFEAHLDRPEGSAGLAAIAWNQGDLTRAGQHFDKALELDPESADLWLRKAELQLATEDLEAAMQSFNRASKLIGGDVLGTIGVARTQLARGNLEEANVEIDKVVAAAPNYPLAHYLKGLVTFQQGDHKASEQALSKVQSKFPDHAPTQYLMGLVKYKLGRFKQAEDNLRRYLFRNEDNESVRKLLASIVFERGDMDAAVDVLSPLQNVSTDPQLYAMLGTAYMRKGELSEATTYLEKAVSLAPDEAPFRNQLALSLLSAGMEERAEAELRDAIDVDGDQFQSDYLIAMLRLRDKDFAAARLAVDSMITKSPESPIGYNLSGAVLLAEGDAAGAQKEFQRSLAQDPAFEPAANNLARLYENQGDRAAAIGVYEGMLQANSDNEAARIGIAELSVRDGDLPKAIKALEQAVIKNPDTLKSRLGLARLYLATNEYSDADEVIGDALRRFPEHPDFMAMQAQSDLRAGNSDRAKQTISKLQSLLAENPKNLGLARMLGDLQLQNRDRTLARSNFERVLELTGGDDNTALLRLMRLDLLEQDFSASESRLNKLRKLGVAESPEVMVLEGDLRLAQGNAGAAEVVYRKLADKGSRDGNMRLATLNFRENKIDSGIDVLKGWLGKNPADEGARVILAGAYLSGGKQSAAMKEYERLSDTGNPIVLNNLAWLYLQENDERALDTAAKAYEAAPKNADIADTFGWVQVNMGSVDEGIRALRASSRINAKNPTVLYHLAVAYQKKGNAKAAKETITQALTFEKFPEREDAVKLSRRL